MKTTTILGIAAVGAGAYWLANRDKVGAVTHGRSATGDQYVPVPQTWTNDALNRPNQDTYYDRNQYGGQIIGPGLPSSPTPGMTGLNGSLTDALAQALSGQSTVKTQSQMNVDAGGGAISTVVIAGVAIVAASYFLGGRHKPKRRRRSRR